MASHPAGQCCTIGVKHEGTAKGQVKEYAGYSTYIATPEKPHSSVAIILLPDVIGHEFINAQLIADQFAANGYTTFMPDQFYGDPVPLNRPEEFDFMKWMQGSGEGKSKGKGHGPDTVDPVVEAVTKAMKADGFSKIGAVGYCFGAKYAIRGLGDGKINVAFVAHPSFVDASEVEAIKGPLSIAAAETDSIFPAEKRHETETILPKTKQPYQLSLFSGVEHGFAVRGDISKTEGKFAKEQAFYQAVQWFDTHLIA